MISTKILVMLLPFMIAAQSSDENVQSPINQQNSPIIPMQGDRKETNKLLGQNKHSSAPMGGFGGSAGYGAPSSYGYGGYRNSYQNYGGLFWFTRIYVNYQNA